jgi:drug/metabolite transporter (DMT)-like permease
MKNHRSAIYLLLFSNLFFASLPIFVKLANRQHYSAMEEIFFRFVVGTSGAYLLVWVGWQSQRIVNMSAVLWRGFFGAVAVITYFISLQTTSSGEGTLLNYTYILWANFFTVVFLKHSAPRGFFLCFFTAAAGVALVLGVHIDHIGFGEVIGIVSGITGGIAVIYIKKARETDSALSLFTSFSIFSLVFATGFLAWGHWSASSVDWNTWTLPDAHGYLILVVIGLVSMAAQVLFTEALGRTSLALGSLFTLSVPVLAAVFGQIFLGESFTPYFGIGMAMVVVSCGYIIWQESKR